MKNRPDRSSVVSNSTKPMLLIAGVEDQQSSPWKWLKEFIRCPTIRMDSFIRQAAHMAMIESPQACANI